MEWILKLPSIGVYLQARSDGVRLTKTIRFRSELPAWSRRRLWRRFEINIIRTLRARPAAVVFNIQRSTRIKEVLLNSFFGFWNGKIVF